MAISINEFEELFKLNHKRLCALAFKIVNDKDGANDIVQEVFIKLWDLREKVHNESLNSYLYTATANKSFNFLKKSKRFETINLKTVYVSNINQNSITTKELEQQITNALNTLPPKCKVIFILSRFEGLRYKEIAEILNISVKTVENQMGKALQIMHEQLKPFISHEFLIYLLGAVYLSSQNFLS